MGKQQFRKLLGVTVLLASALGVGPGVASASDSSTNCPDNPLEAFKGEKPTYRNMEHGKIVSGEHDFETIFRHGFDLFTTIFNECDGKGRPGATGNGVPAERPPIEPNWNMNRVSALDAGNCAVCHNIPRIGGGGDFASTVFVLAQNLDPQSFAVNGTAGNERASPILFGDGAVELLGREISYDLRDIRVECIDAAEDGGVEITRTLTSHGLTFGFLTCFPTGGTNPHGLSGIDSDLIVKPFHQKGAVRSIREFSINPANHHHGIEAEERYGYERTYRTDFDKDLVETATEATLGDMDAIAIYQAFTSVPGQVLPDDPDEQAKIQRGYNRFKTPIEDGGLGCTSCHVEELQTRDSYFLEPYDRNPPGTFNDQSRGFQFNLLTQGAVPRFEPVTPGATEGPMRVRLFSDLKRWVICDDVYTRFCNEQVQQGTASLKAFMTAKLWGVGNSAPYGHRGDMATLSEAILAHGGSGVQSRDAFAALDEEQTEEVINFLKSLQVLPNGARRLVMLQSEVDALNRAHTDEVIVTGEPQAAAPGNPLSGVLARLGGSPLLFVAGLVTYPLLRRRKVRYALHTFVGTLCLAVVLSGVSWAATAPKSQPEASAPALASKAAPGRPFAAMRVWGLNLPSNGLDPQNADKSTGRTPAQGTAPLRVTFNNVSQCEPDCTEFRWDFGDGSPVEIYPDRRQVVHTYTRAGVYNLSIAARNAAGSDFEEYPNYVFADAANPWFKDVSAQSGVVSNHVPAVANTMPFCTGAGWADYDNDGREDLFVSNNGGRSWLWHNDGDTDGDGEYNFTDMATSAGVDNLGGVACSMSWVDYDNDGDQDLAVGNFDQVGSTGSFPRSRLYKNLLVPAGNPIFIDVAEEVGLAQELWRKTTHWAWGDYDNDGLIDVYVVHHTNLSNFATPVGINVQDQLYHQLADHTFENVTTQMFDPIVNTQGYGFSASWVDFDRDGDQDLYVVNDYYVGRTNDTIVKDVLWKNMLTEEGQVRFVDYCNRPNSDACLSLYGMGLGIADFNRDGYQDLALSNIGDSHILKGGPDLLFTDVTYLPGVNVARGRLGQQPSVTWGEYALDYDSNGTSDLLQVAGWLTLGHNEPFIQPDALLSNDGRGQFTDVSAWSGLDDPNRGRGGALADYDQDGQVDWFVANFAEVGRLFHNKYREVTGTNHHWLEIKLEGRASNKDGLGARVEITNGSIVQTQIVGANAGMGGSNSRILHFGTGNASTVRVRVYWPSGRTTQMTADTNQRILIVEP